VGLLLSVLLLVLGRGVDDRAQCAEQGAENFADVNGAVAGRCDVVPWFDRDSNQAVGGGRQARRIDVKTVAKQQVHGVDDDDLDPRSGVRAKHLPITGAPVTGPHAQGVESSQRLRDALVTVGLSLEGAAEALGCSATRVQAKSDPRRSDAPVTYADLLKLAHAGGKAREAARLLHEHLGAALDETRAVPSATALPMLAMQFTVSALDVGNALQRFCATPTEGARVIALKAVGSALRVLTTLHAMLGVRG
jgi:hypothetical protein